MSKPKQRSSDRGKKGWDWKEGRKSKEKRGKGGVEQMGRQREGLKETQEREG